MLKRYLSFRSFLLLVFSFFSIVSLAYAATTLGNNIFTSGTLTSQGKAYLTGGVSTPVLNATSSLIDNLTVDQNTSLATTTISNILTTQAPVNFTKGMVSVKAPFKIEKVGNYALSSSFLKSLFISNNTLFVADGTVSGVKIFDISNPNSLFLAGSTLGGAQSVVSTGNYFYVGGVAGDVTIYSLNNLSSPVAVGGIAVANPYRLIINGKYLYILSKGDVLSGTYDKLVIADVSNPQAPKIISTYTLTSQSGTDLVYQNGYIFLTTFSNGLYIFNVSNPSNPVLVSNYTGNIFRIKVRGRYAYLYDTNGLDTLDISNLATPTLVSNLATGGLLVLSGHYLYESRSNGLAIVDISNPTQPVLVQTYDSGGSNYAQIAMRGNYLYVVSIPAVDTFNLLVLRLSGLSSPTANLGNIQSNNLTVTENTNLNQLNVNESLTVGKNALFNNDLTTQGNLNVLNNATINKALSAADISSDYATTSQYIALPTVKFIPTATPTNPKLGQCFMDNGAKPQVSCYDGTTWHTLW